MSSRDRRPHETATTLNQNLLDFSWDNLDYRIQMILEIERPQAEETRHGCTFAAGSPGIVTSLYNPFVSGDTVIFETSGSLPPELTPGTTYHVKNPSNGDFEVSATAGGASINFTGTGTGDHLASYAVGLIRVSDRNIYVGSKFYEARTVIPKVTRLVGEWLRPTIEFSSLNIKINNVDKAFSGMLPGGENFDGQVNRNVKIRMGLRDVESTYFTIFDGFVTEVGGFKRDIASIKYVARDKFDRLNIDFPPNTFKLADYPKISNDVLGLGIPLIYGDYQNTVQSEGEVPGQIVNKADPQIFFEKDLPVAFAEGSPAVFTLENHNFDTNDKVRLNTDGTLPTPLATGTDYWIFYFGPNTFGLATSPGGGPIAAFGGSGQHSVIAQDLVNVQVVISDNVNTEFNTSEVWLARSEIFYRISPSDITAVAGDLNYFEVVQNSGNTLIEGSNYTFQDADVFLVKVKGKDLGSYDDNPVWQARDMLISYAGISAGEFDLNWTTYRDKATPAQSAIASIKSRAWIQTKQSILEYTLSLLEQIRLEYFISRDLTIKINSLHLEDFDPDPGYRFRNFDIGEDSLKVSIDERNNFNRVQGFYGFNPFLAESIRLTGIFRNQAAIDLNNDKLLYRGIEFPNLYVKSDVENQAKEILRIGSSQIEILDFDATGRQLLLDIGDFLKVNVEIDSTVYQDVPMMIRHIGYGSDLKLPMRLWSWQMTPFGNPGGWDPGYSGIVGGDTAVITEE